MESRDWSSDVCSSDLFPSHDKRAICEADNYHPATETLPPHPLSQIQPTHRTYTALKSNRRKKLKSDLHEKHLIWNAQNPKLISTKYIPHEDLVKDPLHQT